MVPTHSWGILKSEEPEHAVETAQGRGAEAAGAHRRIPIITLPRLTARTTDGVWEQGRGLFVHPLLFVHPPRLQYHRVPTSTPAVSHFRGATPVHARRPHLPYKSAGSPWLRRFHSACRMDSNVRGRTRAKWNASKPALYTRCTRIGLRVVAIIAGLRSACYDAPSSIRK
ncbi:hypothetical protein B0H13DRAFT_1996581 [Mycena leptocephala]|nr:hypothetical protein B0H13DRAFT_1996581 [Mycena leptocephala]